ncbi:hypothetical protein LCI18_000891 [Fusarium solani-melongenae]|uniref:Uncharacterized protein n=1 Tax=Fusarium solani subsp. cucurbitae TaxID=2747967 RepID=A0ACD3YM48_FUSSC|nr:hypothetical protein LCI18_000891 [Fusarium solani-melongenae]
MRPNIAASLAFGLLGADLAAGSVCMPRTSTSISVESSETTQSTSETSSLATLSTSVTTSAESVSTSSSEVASESSSTTAESTTASTTIESFTTQTTTTEPGTTDSSTSESSTIVESSTTTDSSTALTTTTEPATTDSSATESFAVSSTSSAPFVNPTFYFQVNGGDLNDEFIKNDPGSPFSGSRLRPSDTKFVSTPAYVEEGTGRLRTLFNDYYLCIRGLYGTQAGAFRPAEIVLCNTQVGGQNDVNRYQYLTCQLTGSNGISCSAKGISCLTWPGPRADNYRCDLTPDTPFTQFFIYPISGARGYFLYLGPEGLFAGYETVEFKRKVVEQS